MHPREAVHELAQEPGAGDRTGGAAAGILDVSDARLEQLPVLLPERQRPAALAGALARVAYLREQPLIVAEHADGVMAERDHDRPRQRGCVDRGDRLETPGIRPGVAENQAPFRVGVDDLDRLAERALHDVPAPDRRARWKAFRRAAHAHHVALWLE